MRAHVAFDDSIRQRVFLAAKAKMVEALGCHFRADVLMFQEAIAHGAARLFFYRARCRFANIMQQRVPDQPIHPCMTGCQRVCEVVTQLDAPRFQGLLPGLRGQGLRGQGLRGRSSIGQWLPFNPMADLRRIIASILNRPAP